MSTNPIRPLSDDDDGLAPNPIGHDLLSPTSTGEMSQERAKQDLTLSFEQDKPKQEK